MKFLRVGPAGHERPDVRDLTPSTADIDGLGRPRHVLGQA
jgi:hypothetical protein